MRILHIGNCRSMRVRDIMSSRTERDVQVCRKKAISGC